MILYIVSGSLASASPCRWADAASVSHQAAFLSADKVLLPHPLQENFVLLSPCMLLFHYICMCRICLVGKSQRSPKLIYCIFLNCSSHAFRISILTTRCCVQPSNIWRFQTFVSAQMSLTVDVWAEYRYCRQVLISLWIHIATSLSLYHTLIHTLWG